MSTGDPMCPACNAYIGQCTCRNVDRRFTFADEIKQNPELTCPIGDLPDLPDLPELPSEESKLIDKIKFRADILKQEAQGHRNRANRKGISESLKDSWFEKSRLADRAADELRKILK